MGATRRRAIEVQIGASRPVVPGPAVCRGVTTLAANNNLDACDVDGRRYLAWRTAPFHFAHHDVHLHVVSSDDGGETWRHEHSVHLGRDLREPRFLVWGGRLFLYFFTLGTSWHRFEPGQVHVSERVGGSWTSPRPIGWEGATGEGRGVVEWRPRVLSGRPVMTVYRGADLTYGPHPEPTRVELWTTDDGFAHDPWP